MDRRLERFVEAGRAAQEAADRIIRIATLKADDLIWVRNPWLKEIPECLAVVVEVNVQHHCLVIRKRRIRTTNCWGPEQTIPFDDFLRVEVRV
jgi:hypothetical protein